MDFFQESILPSVGFVHVYVLKPNLGVLVPEFGDCDFMFTKFCILDPGNSVQFRILREALYSVNHHSSSLASCQVMTNHTNDTIDDTSWKIIAQGYLYTPE